MWYCTVQINLHSFSIIKQRLILCVNGDHGGNMNDFYVFHLIQAKIPLALKPGCFSGRICTWSKGTSSCELGYQRGGSPL